MKPLPPVQPAQPVVSAVLCAVGLVTFGASFAVLAGLLGLAAGQALGHLRRLVGGGGDAGAAVPRPASHVAQDGAGHRNHASRRDGAVVAG